MTRDLVEEKRDEHDAYSLRDRPEHLTERDRVLLPVVRRRFHACQDRHDVRARARSMICVKLFVISETGRPRRPSFAPSARTRIRTFP